MEILLNNADQVLHNQEMDKDERIVREALVYVWTRVLERYAQPGAYIPPIEEVWDELLEVGVDAAVDVICSGHWFLWSFMVRKDIEKKVWAELQRFQLAEFIEDVKAAQNDPGMLNHLREKVHRYVMEGL